MINGLLNGLLILGLYFGLPVFIAAGGQPVNPSIMLFIVGFAFIIKFGADKRMPSLWYMILPSVLNTGFNIFLYTKIPFWSDQFYSILSPVTLIGFYFLTYIIFYVPKGSRKKTIERIKTSLNLQVIERLFRKKDDKVLNTYMTEQFSNAKSKLKQNLENSIEQKKTNKFHMSYSDELYTFALKEKSFSKTFQLFKDLSLSKNTNHKVLSTIGTQYYTNTEFNKKSQKLYNMVFDENQNLKETYSGNIFDIFNRDRAYLGNDARINLDYNSLLKELANLYKGYLGEYRTEANIKTYTNDYLGNVILQPKNNRHTAEFDFIVIGDNKIYTFENKDYSADTIVIENSGYFYKTYVDQKTKEVKEVKLDTLNQINRSNGFLVDILNDSLDEAYEIVNYIVLSDEETKVINKYNNNNLKIIHTNVVGIEVNRIKENKTFKNKIINIFEKHQVPERKFKFFDIDRINDLLEEALASDLKVGKTMINHLEEDLSDKNRLFTFTNPELTDPSDNRFNNDQAVNIFREFRQLELITNVRYWDIRKKINNDSFFHNGYSIDLEKFLKQFGITINASLSDQAILKSLENEKEKYSRVIHSNEILNDKFLSNFMTHDLVTKMLKNKDLINFFEENNIDVFLGDFIDEIINYNFPRPAEYYLNLYKNQISKYQISSIEEERSQYVDKTN